MSGNWTVNSTITWNDGTTQIRVYGLKPDGTIVEWMYNRGWSGPNPLGAKATPGTPLTAMVFQDNNGVQVSLPHVSPESCS